MSVFGTALKTKLLGKVLDTDAIDAIVASAMGGLDDNPQARAFLETLDKFQRRDLELDLRAAIDKTPLPR